MGIFLVLFVWILVNLELIQFVHYVDARYCRYDTMFCRDVRASLGMFAYKSDVEATRKWLNSSQSKF